MFLYGLSTAVLALSGAHALSVSSKAVYSTFGSLAAPPAGWSLDNSITPQSDARFPIRIFLKNQNVQQFEQRALDISTPGHALYGQHMSQSEIQEILKPSDESIQAVTTWLKSSGLEPTVNHDSVTINTTVADAESLLQTQYKYYTYSGTNDQTLRTTQYRLPTNLHQHISLVTPTTMFGRVGAHKPKSITKRSKGFAKRQTAPGHATVPYRPNSYARGFNFTSCNFTITPECLDVLYKTRGFTAKPSKSSRTAYGIAGYLEEYPQNDDLSQFLQQYDPIAAAKGVAPYYTFQSINQGLNTQNTTEDYGEANLDIQYAVPLTYPTEVIYYQTGGRPPIDPDTFGDGPNTNEPYLDWVDFILAQDAPPATLSTSYGDSEASVPFEYATLVCNKFAQLGARGVSILFPSGDGGPGGGCYNATTNATYFGALFPGSCPWVTTVGATTQILPEEAVGFSGGGFSRYFPAPSYQSAAVTTWQTYNGAKFAGAFNVSNRAYPDVSAQGDNFATIYDGSPEPSGGTSASTPVFGSIVALLNGNLIAQGKKPLGFLNPWLYSRGKNGLVDIVKGKSAGCKTNPDPAVKGNGW
jgi:tripeptidyl-peptidase I